MLLTDLSFWHLGLSRGTLPWLHVVSVEMAPALSPEVIFRLAVMSTCLAVDLSAGTHSHVAHSCGLSFLTTW